MNELALEPDDYVIDETWNQNENNHLLNAESGEPNPTLESSLSGILCARHIMKPERSMYAKQDEQEESGDGAAAYSERGH